MGQHPCEQKRDVSLPHCQEEDGIETVVLDEFVNIHENEFSVLVFSISFEFN
jgi:hypothetical protein